jgi:copper homeostasis protein
LSLLEVIAFDIEGCLVATVCGADRIELCARPDLGGTTPNKALIKQAVNQIGIPVFVMIRPRGGDFVYSGVEFDKMKKQILYCKQQGVPGVVFGILNKEDQVDIERCQILLDLAYPMVATFHRAFDRAADPFMALQDIIELGFHRILTSGQESTALEGLMLIRQLFYKAQHNIIIMPGSGITTRNIEEIKKGSKAFEFHASCKISDPETGLYAGVDQQEVLGLVAALK